MSTLQRLTILCLTLIFTSYSFAKDHEVNIFWLGGPSMLVEFNGFQILTDPMLGEGPRAFQMADPNEMFDLERGPKVRYYRRLTPLPDIDLKPIDLILLSHAHEDHFDQAAQAKLSKSLPFILPQDDVGKVQSYGFNRLIPLNAGETKTYTENSSSIQITAIPADHTDNKAFEPLLGKGLGYVIKFTEGKRKLTLYWTGDSLMTPRVLRNVKALGEINLLIPNMGRVGTTGPLGKISMGAEDVLKLAENLNINNIFPIIWVFNLNILHSHFTSARRLIITRN